MRKRPAACMGPGVFYWRCVMLERMWKPIAWATADARNDAIGKLSGWSYDVRVWEVALYLTEVDAC